MQITFDLTVKQLMSFDPGEWTESLRKEYVLVIEGFFTVPFPLFSATYRRAIQVKLSLSLSLSLLQIIIIFLTCLPISDILSKRCEKET